MQQERLSHRPAGAKVERDDPEEDFFQEDLALLQQRYSGK